MLSKLSLLAAAVGLHMPLCTANSRLRLGQQPGLAASAYPANLSIQVDPTPRAWPPLSPIAKRSNLNTNPDGSTFLWLPQDEYAGKTFFDRFQFFSDKDPTNGHVNYVDRSTAFAKQLVYVRDDGVVIMKGDDTTWLDKGVYRDSVRISSYAQYTTGLFILDLNRAPWGCGTWPAFWTLGNGAWPTTGEIDIIEGVHDNEHNQVAWHTRAGCTLTPEANFTGNIVQLNGQDNLDCNGLVNQNSGCGIIEWSRASYGPYFDSIGGGVFAMKWDENGIAVWSFYRAAIPKDILDGSPDPSQWGAPSAALEPKNCDPLQFFANHSIVFDITFCGDWAGNSYATSGCPGTCEDRLTDPGNFVNATWSINSLKVYRKQLIKGRITNDSAAVARNKFWTLYGCVLVIITILSAWT
ncbi:putative glycosyl hydrolases family 16 [Lyophyllum shimeji]|uniref:Glycosyl hydrolases family 16 n=1 Tax=Lyophyllum shimeji TaxID=47721 RepID=A0A9P3UIX4_LYOSH|nr:putative glycosyl hydrolases family 16 [Lyophyllum shimeji]